MTTPRKSRPAKKASPRRGRPSKDHPIDWLAIEQLYVQGEDKPQPDGSTQHIFPSYADLAARFGLASSSVDRRSRAEDWPAKRDAFQATVRQETQRKAVERLSTRLATFNEEAFETALLGVQESRYALERVRARRVLATTETLLVRRQPRLRRTDPVAVSRPNPTTRCRRWTCGTT